MHAIVWRLICSIVTEGRRKGSQYETGHTAASGYAHFFIDLINENLRLEPQRRRHYIGDQYRNDIQPVSYTHLVGLQGLHSTSALVRGVTAARSASMRILKSFSSLVGTKTGVPSAIFTSSGYETQ